MSESAPFSSLVPIPSPLAIARDKILAQDQGRRHVARGSVVSLGEILVGSPSGEEGGDRARKGEGVDMIKSGRSIVGSRGDRGGTAVMVPGGDRPTSKAEALFSLDDAFLSTSPSLFQTREDADTPSLYSDQQQRSGRDSSEPLIPIRASNQELSQTDDRASSDVASSVPSKTLTISADPKGTPFPGANSMEGKTAAVRATRPELSIKGHSRSGHSHSISFQHLLSPRSRSDFASEAEDAPTSARPRHGKGVQSSGQSLSLSFPSFRSPGAHGEVHEGDEDRVTSPRPIPATVTDLDPEKKMMLIRRARKLERLLGEALSESEAGELVVDPATYGVGGRGKGKHARSGSAMDGLEGLSFPPARGIEDAESGPAGEERMTQFSRFRVSSEPELPSPVLGSFDHAHDPIARPKSSLDHTDATSDGTSSSARYHLGDRDNEDAPICVDDTASERGSWLKRVGSRLGARGSSPSSVRLTTMIAYPNVQKLGRIGRGGSISTQKAIDKDLRDNGVRVLVKQERVTVRTSYLDPSWLPPRPTRNRRGSGISAVARLAELKALRRHSSPVSPTFGVGFVEHGQKLDRFGAETGQGGAQPSWTPLTEAERRAKRSQLAKLHRLLGTRVPIELLLNAGESSTQPLEEVHSPGGPLQPLQGVQTTTEAISGLYEDMPMTPEEKTRAVKRASKMISKFGSAPPVSLYQPETVFTSIPDRSNPHKPAGRAGTYRQSLISIKYLIDNDRKSLNDVLSDLMEDDEGDEEIESRSGKHPLASSNVLRRASSTPSVRRSFDTSIHPESDPPSPLSAEHTAEAENFGLRRKRAGKISKFFGEDNLGSRHLQEYNIVVGDAARGSLRSGRSVILSKVLEAIEQGAEADQAQGLMDDGELDDVKGHVHALRRSVSIKQVGEISM